MQHAACSLQGHLAVQSGANTPWLAPPSGHAQVDFRDAASFDLLKSHVADGYLVESASFAPEKGR